VAGYADPRLRRINNERNLGLAGTRNRSLEFAQGRYVAWLDSDDVSAKRRLERQVHCLESNPDLAICGTWVETIGLPSKSVWRYPTDSAFLRSRMLFDSPLATSSVMMRRDLLGGTDAAFDASYPPAEDYDLWERMSRSCNLTNIPEILTYYRVHPAQTSRTGAARLRQAVIRIQQRQLEQLGIDPSPDEMDLHLEIGVEWSALRTADRALAAREWLHRLAAANEETEVYPREAFLAVLGERWFFACRTLADSGASQDRIFRSSPLSRRVGWRRRARSTLSLLSLRRRG
jgi:glycosyltransferase involved in cell wall biosynthesis